MNDDADGGDRARRDGRMAGCAKDRGSHGVYRAHDHGPSPDLGMLRDLCHVRARGHAHDRGRYGEDPRDCATCALPREPTACLGERRRAGAQEADQEADREVGQEVGQEARQDERRAEVLDHFSRGCGQ